ncbi:MAG: hypothetical protein A07HB70_02186 [uncultured archaeon A07HB70]|nr:MAG: hypothetical protein A07HB70_02186 [uncultured archaeon A07HB70]
MRPRDVLFKYSLTEKVAAAYINTIIRMNQTQTAEALDVSRDTVNRYKNVFT